jgi:hypothetical protein
VRQVSLVPVALSDVEGFQEFRMSTTEWGGHFRDVGRCQPLVERILMFSLGTGLGERRWT